MIFLEAVVEDEWITFGEFLYSEGPENSRLSFSQVGETDAEEVALGFLEKRNKTRSCVKQ